MSHRPQAPPDLAHLLARQDGVVSRSQALGTGLEPHDIARLLRRREWARMAPGVYVDHTGPVTWRQRAWAAVLACWPSALHGCSAVRAVEGPTVSATTGDHELVHVAVDRSRTRPTAPPGVRVHQVSDLEGSTVWAASPPRQRYELAVLGLAARALDDLAAVEVLARACGGRHTTADRLSVALGRQQRVRRRAWLEEVLRDVADGTHSVLEHAYLTRVERPHGLPRGERQRRRDGTGIAYEDVGYEGGAVVELDGFTYHSGPRQRASDLARDLAHAAAGGATVRLGHRQVLAESCATASAVARFLAGRGVPVRPTPCGPGCPVGPLDSTVPRI